MKLLLLACICCTGLLFASPAQAQKVSVRLKQTTLSNVLNAVTRQTGYVFIHHQELDNTRFDINLSDTTVKGVLEYCRQFIPIQFKIIGKNVVIRLANTPPPPPFNLKAHITNDRKEALSEVIVYIPRLEKWILSDKQGNISVEGVATGDSIQFNFVGYDELLTVITGPDMKVALSPSDNTLDDIRVLAYGQTVNRRLNTGSSVQVTAKELQKTATLDPMQALQGRVPGLVVTPNSGLAGANADISIRGVNSMGLTNNGTYSVTAPLFIVDGIPFNNNTLSNISAGLTYYESPFKSIDPNTIESIQVLKDADATAIYGARGANGVILITTKKAKSQGLQFTLDATASLQKMPRFVKMLNTTQYLELRRQGFANDGITMDKDNAPDMFLWDSSLNHNWQKEYFNKTALMNDVQFAVSGGNNFNNFRAAAGYSAQSTIYNRHSGLRKGNFSLSGNHVSKDGKFEAGITLSYTTDRNDVIPMSLAGFLSLPPHFSLYNADGTLNWALANTIGNPVAAQLSTLYNKTRSFNSSASLSYKLGKGWEVKLNAGYNRMSMNEQGKNPIAGMAPGAGTLGNAQLGFNKSAAINIEPQLNYSVTKGKHRYSALLGGTYMKSFRELNSQWATGFVNDADLGDFSKAQTVNYFNNEGSYKFLSGFARLGYSYDEKYVVNITGRRDGSSRFGKGRQYGDFGSLGLAWNFSDEKFFNWIKPAVSFAKLRASYGITGSDAIGDYQYFVNYINSLYTYQGVQGYHPNNLLNDQYQWETTKKLDIGMELGFWNDRISITADYYLNRSGNQLVAYTLPAFTGNDNVFANLNAVVQNSGWELMTRVDAVKTKNFSWTANGNISFIRNKLVSFPGLETSPYRASYFVGEPISSIRGYRNAIINPSNGSVSVDDINKDNAITPDYDYAYLGAALPSYTGGLNNRFSYKRWALDLFMSFKHQSHLPFFNFNPGTIYNQPELVYGNIWEKAGDNKKFPKASATNGDNSYYFFNNSLASYYSGSYLRIASISLNYDLPEKWLHKLHLSRFQAYGIINNLYTFTSNPGFDPETGMSMPNLRTYTIGFRTAF